jgi:hypothetical protein
MGFQCAMHGLARQSQMFWLKKNQLKVKKDVGRLFVMRRG